jgi:Holliday junction resolvase
MANSSKRKGDRAELEIQGWFWDELGVKARRALGAGRKDDVGDIHGVPDTVISVANYAVVMTPEQFAALWREAA